MRFRERAFSYSVTVPLALILAFPFAWMAFTSFKTQRDTFFGSIWKIHPSTERWSFLFHQTNYGRWVENTVLVGVAVVAITLVLALPAGYALARLSCRRRSSSCRSRASSRGSACRTSCGRSSSSTRRSRSRSRRGS
jgi:ABC-type glycerol-3-phosphate transport system permease component